MIYDRTAIVEDLEERIKHGLAEVHMTVEYDRPYTIGILTCSGILVEHFGGKDVVDPVTVYVGAKVCRPDKWSLKRGTEIVITRAARKLADQIVNQKVSSEFIIV